MKIAISISVFLTLVHQCISVGYDHVLAKPNRLVGGLGTSDFCYEGDCGPNGDYDYWESKCKEGKTQSPIDIISTNTTAQIGTYATVLGYRGFRARHFTMWNNGHTVVVSFDPVSFWGGPEVKIFPGFGLSNRAYKFNNTHFHWGKSSGVGSEHLIDGNSYSMELHLVHFDSRFRNLDAALNSSDPKAVAVLAILFKVDPNPKAARSQALAPIVKQLETNQLFKYPSSEKVLINENIDWTSILPTFHVLPYKYKVFNYQGSLTTPPCKEVVDWYVYESPNKISESDVSAFRSVLDSNGNPLVQNHRPVQRSNVKVRTLAF